MTNTIQIPVEEYKAMKEKIALLEDSPLLTKVNKLIDLLYQEKYGLYLGNDTSDLTEASIRNSWTDDKSVWDNV